VLCMVRRGVRGSSPRVGSQRRPAGAARDVPSSSFTRSRYSSRRRRLKRGAFGHAFFED
jgi:hypothetical protein